MLRARTVVAPCAATSTPPASSRSRRRCCSRSTAARWRGPSRPTTTRSTARSTCASPPSSTSSAARRRPRAVYEIGKDFRNEGLSPKHNPEFTMVEWYEAYADYTDEMRRVRGARRAPWRAAVGYDGELDFAPPWRRVTLRDAILERDGRSTSLAHRDRDALAARDGGRARPAAPRTAPGRSSSTTCSRSTSSRRCTEPTFVVDYPVELSPFAKAHRSEPGLVERFEAFAAAWRSPTPSRELNDPDEQRARFEAQARCAGGGRRGGAALRRGRSSQALEHGMPPTGGVGLGIDRLVMVMTGRALDPRGRAVPRHAGMRCLGRGSLVVPPNPSDPLVD